MMIKKIDTSFLGGTKGRKTRISGLFWGSSHLAASRYPPTPPNLQRRCMSVFYNIQSNFKPKFWQENFIGKKI